MATEYMTPMERVRTAMSFREPDRVPVMLSTAPWSMRYAGYKVSECFADVDKYVDAQIRAQRDMGYDSLYGMNDYGALNEAFGAHPTMKEDDVPIISEFLVKTPDDIDRLAAIDNITGRGKIPQLLEIVHKLKERTGSEIPVMACVRPPFGEACTLRGVGNAYKDLLRNPDFFRRLIDFCVEPCTAFAEAYADAGADFIYIPNSAATSSAISVQLYREFSVSYTGRMISRLREKGVKSVYLIDCANKWPVAIGEGADVLFVGDRADMAAIRASAPQGLVLMGCVDNIKTMLQGTPEDVRAEARQSIAAAAKGGGFILAADPPLSADTPAENVRALVDAARRWGTYRSERT